MSLEDPASGGEVAEVGPDEIGDAEPEAMQPDDGDEQPARQYVEVDDPDNRYERVKVDGEDVEVPYSELKRGYSREADYTRKAQALAQQRQEHEFGIRLQQALNADPRTTLQILAQQYGMTVAEAAQAVADSEPEPDYVDPLEREIAQERKARVALEERIAQREADEELNYAVSGLKSQYNLNDEDVRGVINTAYQMGLGVEAFPMIYKTMAFDRIAARVQAQQADQARRNAENTRRQTAKQQASQVVSSGSGATGLTNQADTGGNMSLRDAIEAAFEQTERG